MFKSTQYLVLRTDSNGEQYLDLASKKEWSEILSKNRNGPKNERRYFIKDCIDEGEKKDLLYIEVTKEEYKQWHREAEARRRKEAAAKGVTSLSINEQHDEDCNNLLADNTLLEKAYAKILFKELITHLRAWKPWALELLQAYMTLPKKEITPYIAESQGVSIRTAQRRAAAFEKYVRNALSTEE